MNGSEAKSLELQFVICICIVLSHCRVTFPFTEVFSLFGQCHVTFPYMQPFSFFGRFVQKLKISCFFFQFPLFRKRLNNQMAAVLLQVFSSFYTNDSKKPCFFLQTQMKNKLWVKNTVLLATMTRCPSYPSVDITNY